MSKINDFLYYRVIKWILLPRTVQTNPFSDTLIEKNRVRHGNDINFTRVIVTLAFLGHQTSHLQKKFFFPSCIIYYSRVAYDFFSTRGSENGFFCPTRSNKLHFMTH